MPDFLLVHFTATKEQLSIKLCIDGTPATYYLPDHPSTETSGLVSVADQHHSSLCVEVLPNGEGVLLRALDDRLGSCTLVAGDGRKFQVPLSTSAHLKSVVLRSDEHIFAPAGHWAIRWNDVERNDQSAGEPISHSLVSAGGEDVEATTEMNELFDAFARELERSQSLYENRFPQQASLQPNLEGDGYIMSHTDPTAQPHGSDKDFPGNTPRGLIWSSDDAQLASTPTPAAGGSNEECPGSTIASLVDGGVSGEAGWQGQLMGKQAKAEKKVEGETRKKRKPADKDRLNDNVTTQAERIDDVEQDGCDGARKKPKSSTSLVRKPTQSPEKRRLRGSTSPPRYHGPTPIVIFSGNTSVDKCKAIMGSFKALGGEVSTSIDSATILCIRDGPIQKTGKLVIAVAHGKTIVTENWLQEIHRLGRMPAVQGFVPKDPIREREWKFSLSDAIDRGQAGLTHLLAGHTVFLTKKLRMELGSRERDLSQIAIILGAGAVMKRVPTAKEKEYHCGNSLVIGAPHDPQGAQVGRLGFTVFSRDLLTMAALRGVVERDSPEFVVEVPIKHPGQEP